MTHILEDIRDDALKFMDLWVAVGGQIAVNGFWDKIIPNYVSLLTSDSNATNASKLSSAMSFSASAASGMVGGVGSTLSTSKTVAGAITGKNAPGSLKAKSDVLQSLAGFLQEGLGGKESEKDPYWFLRNFLATAHARKSFNTARTHFGSHDGQSKVSDAKKRKASQHSAKDRTLGRSTRKRALSSDESSEDDEKSSEEQSDTDGESLQTEDSADEKEAEQAGSLLFDPTPVVSFSHATRHYQAPAIFPIHPSTARSSMILAIFGQTQNSGSDFAEATSIPIKVFPQQGGAAASGVGANAGASGSGKSADDSLGGAQGRLSQIKPLISTLHPLLLSMWLDTAPTVFASTTTIHANHALTIVHLVLRIWGILWRAALARPKKNAETEEEIELEREEERWLEEYLQGLLRHVLIYFPFGKDTVAMMDSKVASILQEMNTTYCELTSLFLLGSGIGRVRSVHKDNLKKSTTSVSQTRAKKALKTSYRPSNKHAKKRMAAMEDEPLISSSSDYDSEADENAPQGWIHKNDDMVSIRVETPAWADQVVDFVLDTLGWVTPEGQKDVDAGLSQTPIMSSLSTDFKSQHLVALLPTLWTLLNCLEIQRREWVFEALITYFDNVHVQSGAKNIVLQFLALVIKLQSHPHYTGSFTVTIPGARATVVRRALSGLSKKSRREQQGSIRKMSGLLASSLLKLPKLLWDLGTERIETSQTVLDLLAWVTVIAGDNHVEAEREKERVQFLKTLQSYMALFFCVTVANKDGQGGKRTVMGPFVKLPASLQRRAIEIVFYSGVLAADPFFGENTVSQKKKDALAVKNAPLLAAVKLCCQVDDLPDETRLYIQETLRIA
ncbi:hypothetical protein BGZ54_005803 [Gamsiella multidivaricata]|nr:hypothetical protein BGZ54_005803 [Gamsiella multidivaricata]